MNEGMSLVARRRFWVYMLDWITNMMQVQHHKKQGGLRVSYHILLLVKWQCIFSFLCNNDTVFVLYKKVHAILPY